MRAARMVLDYGHERDSSSGFRNLDLTLAAYVGEPVSRAITPELADQQVGLDDLKSARHARRRELRAYLNERLALAEELLPVNLERDPDWDELVGLYARLVELTGSPVARLNHAVAIAQAGDPERAL